MLRMLVDEEDDAPLKLRQPPSTKDLDEKLRMDAAKGETFSVLAFLAVSMVGWRCHFDTKYIPS